MPICCIPHHNLEPGRHVKPTSTLFAEWPLPVVTLGSSVRAKGIEREIRRPPPLSARKWLTVETGRVILQMPDATAEEFEAAAAIVAGRLVGIAELPILPSEAEDILSISSRERHKWLDDGRLQSAGTKTVKMRGRAKAVTFHVFTCHRACSRQRPARNLARRGYSGGGGEPATSSGKGGTDARRKATSQIAKDMERSAHHRVPGVRDPLDLHRLA
jgi:hypothetical protein